MANDNFLVDDESPATKLNRTAVLAKSAFNSAEYEINDKFTPGSTDNAWSVKTVPELMAYLEANPTTEVDARLYGVAQKGDKREAGIKKFDAKGLVEAWKKNQDGKTFRESGDAFLMDANNGGALLGQDFVPLLGGPFNKQLYYYDYLKMHGLAFQAFHHDPLARRAVSIMRDFTLGRGFSVKCDNEKAMALWDAFVEANDLPALFDQLAIELSIYGEVMLWELPNNQKYITYDLTKGQPDPKVLLPRFRLIDPSVIWEIVTYPEDITRVLYYQWVAPTQYQIYTAGTVPSTKFIFQQIPAEQVMHFKVNCVSNEKRGRSDLFPVLGYFKRLRDSINYQIAALQRASAWSIDTTIQGSQADIDSYVSDVANAGIAPAGSEFVHTDKIKRDYLGNEGGRGGANSPSFEWTLSMIAAGLGIPVSYFGTTVGGHSTRASALVATEPVAKLFEMRQQQLERILHKLWVRVIHRVYPGAKCEITFPEIIIQDRSQKLKDLALAETQGWVSKETAANIAGRELQITSYDYEKERAKILDQNETEGFANDMGLSFAQPLSAPPQAETPEDSSSAVTSNERKQLDDNDGY